MQEAASTLGSDIQLTVNGSTRTYRATANDFVSVSESRPIVVAYLPGATACDDRIESPVWLPLNLAINRQWIAWVSLRAVDSEQTILAAWGWGKVSYRQYTGDWYYFSPFSSAFGKARVWCNKGVLVTY
jgi:hypothetical protein